MIEEGEDGGVSRRERLLIFDPHIRVDPRMISARVLYNGLHVWLPSAIISSGTSQHAGLNGSRASLSLCRAQRMAEGRTKGSTGAVPSRYITLKLAQPFGT